MTALAAAPERAPEGCRVDGLSPCLPAFSPRSKTRGLGAGRKLRILRREERWADKGKQRKTALSVFVSPFLLRYRISTRSRPPSRAPADYKRAHLGNEYKKPFAGCSHAKGIVLEKM